MRKIDYDRQYALRDVIGEYIQTLGDLNPKVMVVNADLMGTCRNRSFVEKYSERAFNVGIAEQNMVSFAAGLAHEGFMPFAFSMAPFISMRACEQCRTDVAYENLNVRLIATYAGCSGGISGVTHWSMEDCAIMGSIPNMVVLEPSDPFQAQQLLKETLSYDGPIYMRSSVEPVPRIYDDESFEIGKATVVREGNDGAFICSGVVVKYALQAAERIACQMNKQIRVVDMHTIKPIDRDAVIDAATTGCIVAAQDHGVIGGLGQSVALILLEEGMAPKFKNIGIPNKFFAMAHAPYLYHQFGYDTDGLYEAMRTLISDR